MSTRRSAIQHCGMRTARLRKASRAAKKEKAANDVAACLSCVCQLHVVLLATTADASGKLSEQHQELWRALAPVGSLAPSAGIERAIKRLRDGEDTKDMAAALKPVVPSKLPTRVADRGTLLRRMVDTPRQHWKQVQRAGDWAPVDWTLMRVEVLAA